MDTKNFLASLFIGIFVAAGITILSKPVYSEEKAKVQATAQKKNADTGNKITAKISVTCQAPPAGCDGSATSVEKGTILFLDTFTGERSQSDITCAHTIAPGVIEVFSGGPGTGQNCEVTQKEATVRGESLEVEMHACPSCVDPNGTFFANALPSDTVKIKIQGEDRLFGASSPTPTRLHVTNTTDNEVTVYVNFAAPPTDPTLACQNPIQPSSATPPCTSSDPRSRHCSFPLAGNGGVATFPYQRGKCLSVTMSFDLNLQEMCTDPTGISQAEATINLEPHDPPFQEGTNISLVNGWNKNIQIEVKDTSGKLVKRLGPTEGLNTHNVFGVFPNACDICWKRGLPPCQTLFPNLTPGSTDGCNARVPGTTTPDPFCQFNPIPIGSTVDIQVLP